MAKSANGQELRRFSLDPAEYLALVPRFFENPSDPKDRDPQRILKDPDTFLPWSREEDFKILTVSQRMLQRRSGDHGRSDPVVDRRLLWFQSRKTHRVRRDRDLVREKLGTASALAAQTQQIERQTVTDVHPGVQRECRIEREHFLDPRHEFKLTAQKTPAKRSGHENRISGLSLISAKRFSCRPADHRDGKHKRTVPRIRVPASDRDRKRLHLSRLSHRPGRLFRGIQKSLT